MNIEVDTHTHTVLSGHAHSTVIENAAAAAKLGLKGFVITDHGPSVQSSAPDYNVSTYSYLPDHISGVRVYGGIEANITDYSGSVDIREKYIKMLDFAIAGMHEVVIESGGIGKDTDAVVGALNNKYIDIISHPDNPSYVLDYEAVVKEAARLGKLLEVNDHSIEFRAGGANMDNMLRFCKKYDLRVAVSSDAHSAFGIGKFDAAASLLKEKGFPESLIVNLTIERFEGYLAERKKRIDAANSPK
ncbi:MAG: PHP domain-containing protein [Burkholderiales bacterium]